MAKYIEIPGNKELRVHMCVRVWHNMQHTSRPTWKKPQQMLMSAF